MGGEVKQRDFVRLAASVTLAEFRLAYRSNILNPPSPIWVDINPATRSQADGISVLSFHRPDGEQAIKNPTRKSGELR
ncbi:hypothetical protein PMIT1320_01631 [Prochlorococcus marinus str. MIT 1320]|nr:hypothetical protein PMIT1320_01631 [Prochlorococcus marinus str. MIT 1320]